MFHIKAHRLRSASALLLVTSLVPSSGADVIITEWVYSGSGGEFVEFTNTGPAPVDLTGWSFDDDSRLPGGFDLSAFGIVMPGESVVMTEDPAQDFRSTWGLDPEVKVIGDLGSVSGGNLGRNDEINLFDELGQLVDRLTYGDEDFPGSIRAQEASGNPGTGPSLGSNNVYDWVLSTAGDAQDSSVSTACDIGNPGRFTAPASGSLPGAVVVSHASGFYSQPIVITIEADGDGNGDIHYTLDGSLPSLDSPVYSGPILIEDRSGEPNHLSHIQSSPLFYLPDGLVFKGSALRAARINSDGLRGDVETHTFIIHPDGPARFSLPVVSLVTDEHALFDYHEGIYVPGFYYDEYYDPQVDWYNRIGNYTQRGDDWERPAHIQFFEPNGTIGFSQNIGLRTHGGVTRSFRRKSLRVYARSEYGQSRIEYPLFPGDSQTAFKRLILRNSGNDYERTMFRDAFIQDLVKDTGVATQGHRPAIVLINGEYWGIHNIRQRFDKHFLELRKGVDPENIDYLTNNAEVEEGDNIHFLETYDYLLNNDMSDPIHYEYARSRIDIENMTTYFSIGLFIANSDWPQNNIDYWRSRTPDGRWRWLLYDTDLSFNYGLFANQPNFDAVNRVVNEMTHRNARLFQRLLLNDEFRGEFLNRSADLMNAELSVDNMSHRLDQFRDIYAPEIGEHISRWRAPDSVDEWNDTMIHRMQLFIDNRADSHRQHLADAMGVSGLANLELVVPFPYRGTLTVNTIALPPGTAEWAGVYFDGVAVPISGSPAKGYRFAGFEEIEPMPADDTVHWLPSGDQSLTAKFVCEADMNADGAVNFFDISEFLTAFANGDMLGDFNGDGQFNFFDISEFLQSYQGACP
ncbi:MAG: CotH kinase family protein [Phycisphaerales bacterium]